MTIQDAKEEIKRTVKAYHQRDENGKYKIPVEKQRPLFLIGPPGIKNKPDFLHDYASYQTVGNRASLYFPEEVRRKRVCCHGVHDV